MEKLKSRYGIANDALERLDEDIQLAFHGEDREKYYLQFRRSTIQSFEVALDVFWKYLREFLIVKHGMPDVPASPKGVTRSAYDINLLNDKELQLLNRAISARNETSHIYHEATAEKIFQEIPKFAKVIEVILKKIDFA